MKLRITHLVFVIEIVAICFLHAARIIEKNKGLAKKSDTNYTVNKADSPSRIYLVNVNTPR